MIARRKIIYPVSQSLRQYLYHFDRQRDIPRVYNELSRFTGAIPYEDPRGRETLWLTVMYPREVFAELRPLLTRIYSELKLGGSSSQHEHLMIDRSHPRWGEALSQLVDHLQAVKQRAGASQILLRDFPMGDDEAMRARMLELGFFEYQLPDMMTIDHMGWADREQYLASLGGKYRYNLRKEAIAFEDRFEMDTSKELSESEVEQCYALYRAVHARSLRLNVFPLPLELFRAMLRHPEYDVIRLFLREEASDGPRRPVAVLVSHRGREQYTALLVGLDDSTLYTHKTYKQVLFRCVERARALGCTRMNLAFTADLEKKKLGARPQPTCAYVQLDDD